MGIMNGSYCLLSAEAGQCERSGLILSALYSDGVRVVSELSGLRERVLIHGK